MKTNFNPIKTIKALYYANRPLYAKMPPSRIKYDGVISDRISKVIAQNEPSLNKMAELSGIKNVNIDQRGKTLLINSGAYTSAINVDGLHKDTDTICAIYENVSKNLKV